MPFLRGSLGFERFSVSGFEASHFDDEHIEKMSQHAAGRSQSTAIENVHVGFLGGSHLFDQQFDLSKNVIQDAVHFGIRIDTNQIPAAIRAAWLQMELDGIAKDNESGVPTKSQRKEAKEAVEQRCEVEAASGKYRKMQQFSLLWDLNHEQLYFGGSVGTASGLCMELLERVFEVELRHIGAGTLAESWSIQNERYAEVDDLQPTSFTAVPLQGPYAWANEHAKTPEFLGNEFLLWLWWSLENQTDTIALADESEVTVMLNKTLAVECPAGESGKDTFNAEAPVQLPEARQAIRCGKLPRKAGMTIVREGRQFDLVLQAERFGISGAKIHLEDDEEFENEDRIDAIRLLSETVDMMFYHFCDIRSSSQWNKTLPEIRNWVASEASGNQAAA
ncbi:hypothetical protein [Roseimaritima sediminicola]|uniref:hypothetical protein n=1 Tax=Roseimaritima sediminicola TaxID=2662066 RepID=UPI00129845FD|nr:hypothetical protein [Roseimaritima sediminicola]